MRWKGRRGSTNVRRGGGGAGMIGGGIGTVVIALLAFAFGIDPRVVMQGGGGAPAGGVESGPATPENELEEFVFIVLADTEEVWQRVFREELGQSYSEPTLVLFEGSVQSGCGFAQAAMGPFYCPLDQSVYIDLGFYRELRDRLGAPGDFAQAYVIAHEVGHHVQTLLGVSEQVRAEKSRVGEAEANELSVRQELQADCFAGIWANRADEMWAILEPGDIQEALGAASAVGDDRLQSQARGRVSPESFTHGTSEQRMRWFQTGYESGTARSCDTFSATRL